MYYVYLIRSLKDSSLYIGYTNDLKRRLIQHNSGQSQYTKTKMPYKLIYYEAYQSQEDALIREKRLKRFAKAYQQLKKRIANSLELGPVPHQ